MRWKLLAVVGLSSCLCAISTLAQFKASLQGTVMDPSGNAVAGAKISIVEQNTGLTREATTSDQGFYRIALLPPGSYTVTVEVSGFKKFSSKGVVVEAEEPRGLDINLEVGAVTESVTVTSSTEALHTENA